MKWFVAVFRFFLSIATSEHKQHDSHSLSVYVRNGAEVQTGCTRTYIKSAAKATTSLGDILRLSP